MGSDYVDIRIGLDGSAQYDTIAGSATTYCAKEIDIQAVIGNHNRAIGKKYLGFQRLVGSKTIVMSCGPYRYPVSIVLNSASQVQTMASSRWPAANCTR